MGSLEYGVMALIGLKILLNLKVALFILNWFPEDL